jgi:di-N-acetylchitobiase
LELGIEAQKLVLGVPWYGYRYPCVSGTLADARYCPLEYRPFRGVPCSDAIGVQVPFGNIVKERMIEPQWDSTMLAPFFNTMENTTKDNSLVQQYWYDDSQSLKLKYAWARSNELRGLGPYTFDDLNGAPAQEIQSMWSAFDTFLFDTASPLLDLSTT